MRAITPGDAATGLLVLCALLVAAVTVRREVRASRSSAVYAIVSEENNWQAYADAGHVLGPPNASVTIVEFSDFECPVCARFATHMDSLWALGADVKVLYRHAPGSGHRNAIPAVQASECAARQGRFPQMHRVLFEFQDSLGKVPWWWFAQRGEVSDSASFDRCMLSADPIPALAADTVAAQRLKAPGTPTLLIHNVRLNGLPAFDSLRVYIDRAKAASR